MLAKPCGPLLLRRKVESVIRLRESGGRQEPDQEDELTGLLKREVFCQKAEELLRENPEETYTVFALTWKISSWSMILPAGPQGTGCFSAPPAS